MPIKRFVAPDHSLDAAVDGDLQYLPQLRVGLGAALDKFSTKQAVIDAASHVLRCCSELGLDRRATLCLLVGLRACRHEIQAGGRTEMLVEAQRRAERARGWLQFTERAKECDKYNQSTFEEAQTLLFLGYCQKVMQEPGIELFRALEPSLTEIFAVSGNAKSGQEPAKTHFERFRSRATRLRKKKPHADALSFAYFQQVYATFGDEKLRTLQKICSPDNVQSQ